MLPLLLALAFGCQLTGSVIWVWLEVITRSTPYPSFSDLAFLSYVPALLTGMLLLPARHRTRREWAKLGLDIVIVAASGFMIIWYLVLGPTLAAGGSDPLAVATSVSYPAGELVLITGTAIVLLRGAVQAGRRPLQILIAGVAIMIVGDTLYAYMGLHGGFAGGGWLDLVWITADFLFAVSAHRQYQLAGLGEQAEQRGTLILSANRLPYIAVALAYALLLIVGRGQHLYPLGGMIVAAVALTAAVVLRQMGALNENRTMATTDSLTGIANRALMTHRLNAAVAQARRTGWPVGVLVVDLDRFKPINDTFGHEAGDAVLVATAAALRSVVRSSDLAGRLGGDEFAVVLEPTDIDSASAVARRILAELGNPTIFDGHLLAIEASIGIAISTGETVDGDDLLRRADTAMYAAKRSGAGHYKVYTPEMDTGTLELELQLAIEHGQFVLHYQPIVDLGTDAPVGVEALIRWQHPTRGLLGRAAFIPLAEETGQILPIGAWALREACAQLERWRQENPAMRPLTLSVNVSARQVRHPSLVGEVTSILRDTGFDPDRLVLELTEGVLIHDDEATLAKIEALRDVGVRIAVDDFGTGYSTLSYLRRLPVDILKIDRSFIADILDSEDSWTIGEAVVRLGLALKLDVVAEGIETAEQLQALRRMRCTHGQGFHFARPLEAAHLMEFLSTLPALMPMLPRP